MSDFPKIDSPCPLRWKSLPSAERNYCTHCSRKVHNLNGMSEMQRRTFLAGCSGSVCVAYTVPRRHSAAVAAGIGLAAALSFTTAAAADNAAQQATPSATSMATQTSVVDGDANEVSNAELIDADNMILLGAVQIGAQYEEGEDELPQDEWMDSDLPELPLLTPDDLREPAEFIEPPDRT
jgi:hypothetical protein